MKTIRTTHGFTLIEILVAVFILGIIFSFIFGALTSSLASAKEATARMDIGHTGRFIAGKMASDIASASLLPMSGKGRLWGRHFMKNGKRRDEIHFTAFSRTYFTGRPQIDQSEIGYYFRIAKNGEDALMRREADVIERPVDQGGESLEISPAVEELAIRYQLDDKWVDEWDSESVQVLPKAVSVECTLADGKHKYLFTAIARPAI
ncbi:MAG: prepilin-type N-terminal cleavage/methylation domain-containing protein [Nitrospinae bacterium]|nr:prepilin-type N-terminal cleavage/methylation domain-containing protein [Nitrospinota bacterium]